MVVGTVRAFRNHDVGSDTGKIGLVGHRNQVEHQAHLIVERVQLAKRRFGHVYARQIPLLRQLDATFDLAHGVEVAIENHAVARAQLALQRLCALGDQIEKTLRLIHDRLAFFGRIAFTKQLREDLARVEFHR